MKCYVLMSLQPANAFLRRLNWTIVILGLSAIVLAGLLLSFVSRTITHPLDDLVAGVRALAEGDYAYSINPRGSSEVAELGETFSKMRGDILISEERRIAAARVKARLDQEIEIASGIQQRLLPKSLPNAPSVAVAGWTLACQSVGGDCFDVIDLGNERHGFFVGDVSGKGISAALLATLLQGVFFTTASMDMSLPGVFARVNEYLCERIGEDRFATVFYGILDKKGRFDYANAGHVPPLVRRRSGALEALSSENFPVGMIPDAEYQSARVDLDPGDFVVIYTDGVSEAVNPGGDMFEEVGLRRVLEEFKSQSAQDLCDAIREGMKGFTQGAPQSDDITILTIQYKGSGS